MLLSSRKVLVLENQFMSPCPCLCPWTSIPCPCSWTTKFLNIVSDFAFRMYRLVCMITWSINSVTAVVHEVTVKNGLLTDVNILLVVKQVSDFHFNPVLLIVLQESPCPWESSRTNLQVFVFVLEPRILDNNTGTLRLVVPSASLLTPAFWHYLNTELFGYNS